MKSVASQSSSSGCVGGVALRAEIFERLHDAAAEGQLPQAIDEDAGGERIVGDWRSSGPGRGGSGASAVDSERHGARSRNDRNAGIAGCTISPLNRRASCRGAECASSAARPTSRRASRGSWHRAAARSFSSSATCSRAVASSGACLRNSASSSSSCLAVRLAGFDLQGGQRRRRGSALRRLFDELPLPTSRGPRSTRAS